MVGTTDANKKYYPFGIAITLTEDADDFEFIFESVASCTRSIFEREFKPSVLVADGSHAISNGFEAAFGPGFSRVMCWAHVIRKVDERLRSISDKQTRAQIRSDISIIQLSSNQALFNKAIKLFMSKWKAHRNATIDDFLAYFHEQ